MQKHLHLQTKKKHILFYWDKVIISILVTPKHPGMSAIGKKTKIIKPCYPNLAPTHFQSVLSYLLTLLRSSQSILLSPNTSGARPPTDLEVGVFKGPIFQDYNCLMCIVVNVIGIVTFSHFISNSFLHFVPISFASQPRENVSLFSFLFETYFRQKFVSKENLKLK